MTAPLYSVPNPRRSKRLKRIRFDSSSDRRRPDLIRIYDDGSYDILPWSVWRHLTGSDGAGHGLGQ